MKAKTAAQKRKAKRGRPPKQGVQRTESGRISRSAEASKSESRLVLEIATWRRRRENPSLTIEEARSMEHGNVISKWLERHKRFQKRYPDKPNEFEFSQMHYDAALRYHELKSRYEGLIGAKTPRSASDFGGAGGYDGSDPFEENRAANAKKTEADYKNARTAILNSGPLGMMAVEAIIIENREIESLLPDLRCACNGLSRLWRMVQAA